MNEKIGYLVCAAAIIALLVISGCVAPPKESPADVTYTYNPDAPVAAGETTSGGSSYVTIVPEYVITPKAGATPVETLGYHTFVTPTPIPVDKSCRIYSTTQVFSYNGTAFTFNLKNPPMYINYTVTPQNITVNKAATSQYLTKQDVVYKFSTYDPQSYFVITVKNKTSGKVYLEDGFGTDYTTYLTRNLKVLNTDDMLIEMKGNKITATVNFWVKPPGNFENAENMTFDACTYWEGAPRDNTAVAFVTATTTATWAPSNVIEK
jgi:hypothetical protein